MANITINREFAVKSAKGLSLSLALEIRANEETNLTFHRWRLFGISCSIGAVEGHEGTFVKILGSSFDLKQAQAFKKATTLSFKPGSNINILLAMRMISIRTALSEALRDILELQEERYETADQVDEKCIKITKKLTTAQMMSRITMYKL